MGAGGFDGEGVGLAAGARGGEGGGGGEDAGEGVGVGDNGFVGHHQLAEEVHDVKRGGVGLLLGEGVDETVP